jgi:hypothetical protein
VNKGEGGREGKKEHKRERGERESGEREREGERVGRVGGETRRCKAVIFAEEMKGRLKKKKARKVVPEVEVLGF